MITADAIQRMALAQQTTTLNIAREYAQHLFLAAFYQQHGAHQVLFKGGTALRIAYHSPRFSEDLDFSGFGVRVREIEDSVVAAAGAIEQSGIMVAIEESKKTSGGYLGIVVLTLNAHPVRILVEISLRRRNGIKGRGALVTPDELPAYTLTLLPEADLVAEKLAALLDRAKPRDFFDCYFMLRKNMIPPKQRRLLSKIKQILAQSRFNFKAELADFLPRSQQPILNDFKKTLMIELERYG